jgi:hypothetical protein
MSKPKARGSALDSEGSKNADPLAPLLEGVFVPGDMFRRMIDNCDADELERVAARVAEKDLSTMLETYRRERIPFDFEVIMAEILSGYFHMFRIEGNSSDGRRRVMTLTHKWGPKWSRYLRGYLQSAYGTVSKEKVDIEISGQSVQISFTPDRAPPR